MTKRLLSIRELLGIRQRFSGSMFVNRADANETVRLLLGHVEFCNERRFNELMAAKLSGYRDARSEMAFKVSGMVSKLDQILSVDAVKQSLVDKSFQKRQGWGSGVDA